MEAAIIAVAASLVASGTTYFVARRTTSGNINTSDATTLWAEANSIRKELRDELEVVRQELVDTKLSCQKDIYILKKRLKEVENHQ